MNGHLPADAQFFPPGPAVRAGEPSIPARTASQAAAEYPEVAELVTLAEWSWSRAGTGPRAILIGERAGWRGVDTLYIDPDGRHAACHWGIDDRLRHFTGTLAECVADLSLAAVRR